MSLTNAGISVLNKKVLKCEKQQCVDGSTKMKMNSGLMRLIVAPNYIQVLFL